MQKLKRVLRWLGDHWMIPVVALFGVMAFLAGQRQVTGRRRTPLSEVREEREALRAESAAASDEIERGTDAAVEAILEEKRRQIDALGHHQHKQAQRLLDDPRALAGYLVRVGLGR